MSPSVYKICISDFEFVKDISEMKGKEMIEIKGFWTIYPNTFHVSQVFSPFAFDWIVDFSSYFWKIRGNRGEKRIEPFGKDEENYFFYKKLYLRFIF